MRVDSIYGTLTMLSIIRPARPPDEGMHLMSASALLDAPSSHDQAVVPESEEVAAARNTFERSYNQRMDALARANEIRIKRSQLKRDLKSGRRSIHGLLVDPPEFVETAKVFDMLLAVPRYGRVKVNRILAHCRISPSKTIGGMTERQRAELLSQLYH
jgi:hypothetical protein